MLKRNNSCTADTIWVIRPVHLARLLHFLSIRPCPEEEQVLEVASAVERGCRHPLAEAVVSAAEKGLPEKTPLDASGLRTVPGMGASAQVIHEPVKVGLSYYQNVAYHETCFFLTRPTSPEARLSVRDWVTNIFLYVQQSRGNASVKGRTLDNNCLMACVRRDRPFEQPACQQVPGYILAALKESARTQQRVFSPHPLPLACQGEAPRQRLEDDGGPRGQSEVHTRGGAQWRSACQPYRATTVVRGRC